MADWLPSLITATRAKGHELAIKLARVTVKKIKPEIEVREGLRPRHAEDAALIVTSRIAAAAANDPWRDAR